MRLENEKNHNQAVALLWRGLPQGLPTLRPSAQCRPRASGLQYCPAWRRRCAQGYGGCKEESLQPGKPPTFASNVTIGLRCILPNACRVVQKVPKAAPSYTNSHALYIPHFILFPPLLDFYPKASLCPICMMHQADFRKNDCQSRPKRVIGIGLRELYWSAAQSARAFFHTTARHVAGSSCATAHKRFGCPFLTAGAPPHLLEEPFQ